MRTLRVLLPSVLVSFGAASLVASCTSGRGYNNLGNHTTGGFELQTSDVNKILAQTVSQAQASLTPCAIAVCDREGEVLGAFVTAPHNVANFGQVACTTTNLAFAIAKAATAAAFQSEGEAFTTRTAYYIVQGHFPPGVQNAAGGPLFGVQDSGTPSSDAHILAYDAAGDATGAGIIGLFGGIPLYVGGEPVGGIGVDTAIPTVNEGSPNGTGAAPTNTEPFQRDMDELLARAGARGYEAPWTIQATQVFVGGFVFPFYAGTTSPPQVFSLGNTIAGLSSTIGTVPAGLPVRVSSLSPEVTVGNQFGIRNTQRYLGRAVAATAASFSGTFTNVDRPATVQINPGSLTFTGVPVVPLASTVRGGITGEDRHPPIDSIDPPPGSGGLSKNEVELLLANGAQVARSERAAIRRPIGSFVVVHITVVDRRGNILGTFRMGDGTLFSFDVAVQKARTAAFFSTDVGPSPACALTPRSIGFLAQPFFPPGIDASSPGALVTLRDLVNRGKIPEDNPPDSTLVQPLARMPSDGTTDENPLQGGFQTFNDFNGGAPEPELFNLRSILTGGIPILMDRPDLGFVSPGIQSGIQTFPGGCPLYRGGHLIGGIGVSGDGVDQDDSVAFEAAGLFPTPNEIRCDAVPESEIIGVIQQKIALIRAAIDAHPDSRIRKVYGPIIATQQEKINNRLSQGFGGNTIPFIKLPRNPELQ